MKILSIREDFRILAWMGTSQTIQQILIRYWGYSRFREMQEDIILSVMAGRDTLALLPTGGGKSICYQVPALAMEGKCLVISPLIALMKDQVDNLKKRNVKAIAVYSGMSRKEIDIAVDNAVHDPEVKLLYVSPERLQTKLLQERLKRMKVNLVAVDEAHCISQWGYDFRPPYLQIARIRDLLPGVPVMALTATATPEVVLDIQDKLQFRERNVFQKSFERENLAYMVRKEENKLGYLLKVCSRAKGTGVVYVRNRRKTREISDFLNRNGITSEYYHAGLNTEQRDLKQRAWMSGSSRIMVSTNAFGMGIDKPDVRFVIHVDLPDCLEAYFQEAGRAGRDGLKSHAVLVYENADVIDGVRNLETSYPEIAAIRKIYNALGNYYQLATGSGQDVSFDFDDSHFCQTTGLQKIHVYKTLQILEREGYLLLSDAVKEPSRMHIPVGRDMLYEFQVKNKKLDPYIKLLLRMYGGLFSGFVPVSESEIASKASLLVTDIKKVLETLHSAGIAVYVPQTDKPRITWVTERLDERDLYINPDTYGKLKQTAFARFEAITDYVSSTTKCRSQILLTYFGETDSRRCGVCDVCKGRNKLSMSEYEFNIILDKVKPVLQQKSCTMEELAAMFSISAEDNLIKVIRWLLDNDKIEDNGAGRFRWL
jgi:ATP-dependent DNA helicase RecQ